MKFEDITEKAGINIGKNLERASSNLSRNDYSRFTKVTEEAGMLQ